MVRNEEVYHVEIRYKKIIKMNIEYWLGCIGCAGKKLTTGNVLPGLKYTV